jgi:hypothetical protein
MKNHGLSLLALSVLLGTCVAQAAPQTVPAALAENLLSFNPLSKVSQSLQIDSSSLLLENSEVTFKTTRLDAANKDAAPSVVISMSSPERAQALAKLWSTMCMGEIELQVTDAKLALEQSQKQIVLDETQITVLMLEGDGRLQTENLDNKSLKQTLDTVIEPLKACKE